MNRARADRILNAAGDLLLRMGYRKVAVDDIARAAGIGKGTVYLHWRNKERVFEALLQRESVELIDELITRLREDPAEAQPRWFLRASFLIAARRPLIMAILSGDADTFGTLKDRDVYRRELLAIEQWVALMTHKRLLRTDVPDLAYAICAASVGFYLIDATPDRRETLSVEARADAVAHLVGAAFEFPGEPDPAETDAAAAELIVMLEEFNSVNRKAIYTHSPTT